jgi:hypothetical protein
MTAHTAHWLVHRAPRDTAEAPHTVVMGSSSMTRRFAVRPLERSLATIYGELRCPRAGRRAVTACEGCAFFCRTDRLTASVICSYPLPATDTYARRARHREEVRIALSHHLERT